MGLTVADLTQTLFPIATGAAQLASNPGLHSGFAALLQGLLGTDAAGAEAAVSGLTADLAALTGAVVPGQEGQDKDKDKHIDPLAQALLALAAGLGADKPKAELPAQASEHAREMMADGVAGKRTPDSGQHGLHLAIGKLDELANILGDMPELDPESTGMPVLPDTPPATATTATTPATTPPAELPAMDLPQAVALADVALPAADAPVPLVADSGPSVAESLPSPSVDTAAQPLPDAPAAAGLAVLASEAQPGTSSASPTARPSPIAIEADAPGAAAPPGAPGTNASAAQNTQDVVRSVGNVSSSTGLGAQAQRDDADTSSSAPVETDTSASHAVGQAPAAGNQERSVEASHSADAPARTPVELPEATRQVGRAVVEQIERGGGSARIRLDPPELGRVSIDVRSEGAHIRVDIHAERPEAAQLLKDHAGELAQLFQQHGFNLDVQVGLGGRSRGQGNEHQQGAFQRSRSDEVDFAKLMGLDPRPPVLSNRVRAAYNPDGRHLYRI
jgi:flagellar hook-length control protein FliK